MANRRFLFFLNSLVPATLLTTLVATPTIYFNKQNNNNLSNNYNATNLQSSTELETRLSHSSNRNTDYESPNGILQKKNQNNNIVFSFTSYFNTIEWTYNLVSPSNESNKSILSSQSDFSSLLDAQAKYNPYANTYFIYGTYLNASSNKIAFLFQIDANTGQEIIINGLKASSIWTEKTIVNEIEDIVITGENSVLAIPKYQYWNTTISNTMIFKINYSAYTSTQIQMLSLASNNNPMEVNKDANKYQIGSIFDLGDNGRWGITYLDVSDNNNFKYKYLFFDSELNYKGGSSAWQSIPLSDNGTKIGKNYGSISVADPMVFKSSSTELYTIFDANVNPIFDSSFNDVVPIASNYFRKATFTWSDTAVFSVTHDATKSEFMFNGRYHYVYQFKKDSKNNTIYLSVYPKSDAANSEGHAISWHHMKMFGYKINPENSTITSIATKTKKEYTFSNAKAVVNFSVINDYHLNSTNPENSSTKSPIVKEISKFNSNTTVTQDSIPIYLLQYRNLGTNDTSNQINIGSDIEWSVLKKSDYLSAATSSSEINKLPIDVDETVIPTWLNYTSGSSNVDYFNNLLETLTATSGYNLSDSGKVLYNNTTGSLKARVKTELTKWWYENPSTGAVDGYDKFVEYTDMTINGFATVDSLMFQLVTNSQIDAAKWDKISNQYLGKKLPSQITVDIFLEDFINKGNKINLTTSDVNIVTSNSSINNDKAINLVVDDANGTLYVAYNLINKSSPSVETSFLYGNYTYTGFLKTSSFTQITLDTAKFDALKSRKLAYEFTVEDLLNVVNLSDGYNTDLDNWTLSYTHLPNTEEYNNNLINGTTGFTLKHKRDAQYPSSVTDTMLQVVVDATNGNGCKKLEDYIGGNDVSSITNPDNKLSGIYFDQQYANSLTGLWSEQEIEQKVSNLLQQTLSVNLDWFNVSLFKAAKNKESSTNNKLVFDLSLDENISSNIYITNNGVNKERLVITKALQDKLKLTRPNMLKINFSNSLQVTFNYQSISYNWNYDIEHSPSANSTSVNFNSLVEKINVDRANNNQELLTSQYKLASEFVEKYKYDTDLFKKDFNLISAGSSAILKNVDINDPNYFEITTIDMIPNDPVGTVLIKYKLYYPNLSQSYQVTSSPEILLTGFPSSTIFSTTLIVIFTSIIILLIAIVIWIIIISNSKRNKAMNQHKLKIGHKKTLLDKFKKKVVKK